MLRFALAACLVALLASTASAQATRGVVLADFESGQVVLESYEDQDIDPDDWSLTHTDSHNDSNYSLRLFGNTWKAQPIVAYPIEAGTVWSVAASIEELGEIQGFGIDDGVNRLFYTFAGTQLQSGSDWDVSYQGAFEAGVWNEYLLPVGRDWYARYGYYPSVSRLIYLNDRDAGLKGIVLFDDIVDVTSDLPVAPGVEIVQGRQNVQTVSAGLWRVSVNFHAQVDDPDSQQWTYSWDFGDSTFSNLQDPSHDFIVTSDHTYTVSLDVRDDSGMWGHDTLEVRVDPGGFDPPVKMNFVGDVMLARAYDEPGGLIDQHGPQWMFIPTKPIYGDAADISVCNNEMPFTDEGERHPTKSIVFRARPSNVAGLVYAGIDVVSLGNNHAADYMRRGLEETIETLDGARIRWTGAGMDEYQAFTPTYWTERGTSIAFLGMCNRTGREYNYQPFLDAAMNKLGFAYLIEPQLGMSIAATKPLADLTVVQLHAGIEYAIDPGKRDVDPAALEAALDAEGPVPGMMDVRFPTRPSFTDRQLKWRAVDGGADLVIAHHPHVLQGFEVYNGVLIAHSLGNFVFDQSYAETMPTLVLNSEFTKSGFRSFTFRPAFIDEKVPQPASGRLGREILDRQADYSRELNTIVTVDPEAMMGTIQLHPENIVWTPEAHEATVPLSQIEGRYVSIPIEREGLGMLSRVTAIEGAGLAEVRVGREILWHGSMEPEGATFWNLNSADEVYDATTAHSGARSLRQHRTSNNTGPVQTDLDGYPAALGGTDFSVCGWVKTQNAVSAGILARVFASRGGQLLASQEAGAPISGTADWTYLWSDFAATESAHFFNMRPHMDKPEFGENYAWFDDVRLIEWEPWQAADLPLALPYPSNIRYIQVRFTAASANAVVRWEDVRAEPSPSLVSDDAFGRRPEVELREGRPNPTRSTATIEYLLPRAGQVRLEIFDVTGRRVARIADGVQTAGWHTAVWDARTAASGLYLCRLATAGEIRTAKLLVLQ
jgi:poly-gamma-glutamate capsule biosynthesis protein CapA/YwtB (metallophosphatase superfamily)